MLTKVKLIIIHKMKTLEGIDLLKRYMRSLTSVKKSVSSLNGTNRCGR